jgi:hypothetical protein
MFRTHRNADAQSDRRGGGRKRPRFTLRNHAPSEGEEALIVEEGRIRYFSALARRVDYLHNL